MSDKESTTKSDDSPTTQENGNLDLDQHQHQHLAANSSTLNPDLEHSEAVRPPHIPDGHTFLVTTVVTETTTTAKRIEQLKAVPVMKPQQEQERESEIEIAKQKQKEKENEVQKEIKLEREQEQRDLHCIKFEENEEPSCSSKAVVPLSSSLPSRLLRFHAKRSAQALLHQMQHQGQSLDSQFSSDEGSLGATGGSDCATDELTNECATIFDSPTPSAPSLSPMPHLSPLASPVHSSDERLIDVGMGSSIEGSVESEEDDELKPLAVDNHVIHNVDLISLPLNENPTSHSPPLEYAPPSTSSSSPPVLSEANLEKFRRHYHNVDNIYLHPNFKHDYESEHLEKDTPDRSPPPAVAPANSPIEQRRAHRSFLTMKKPTDSTTITAEIIAREAPSTTAPSSNTELSDAEQSGAINEIDTLDPSLIPSDELAAEIADAVEFYFSNESILKDAFLLKHVRRNKEGFVSLKLVSSFKRVRQLTKEWKVVGDAVRRKSRKIELNDLGTKVRRVDPLPIFDETMPSRTIVACDLPLDKLTIEKVSDIFSKCGEIALIRLLKPGMAIPVDVRQFMNKYPEMLQKECALVEYLESSSAREAKNLQGPFQVYEMVAPKKKTGKKAIIQLAAPVARMVENYRYYNDASYERTRGGSFSGVTAQDVGDLRYKLKRNNSDFHPRNYPDLHQYNQLNHHHHHHHSHQQQAHYHSNNSVGGSNNSINSNNHHHHYSQQQQQQQQHHHHRGSFGEHSHSFQHYQPRGSISHDQVQQESSTSSSSQHQQQQQQQASNGGSFFGAYSPRRYSNTSTISATTAAALGDVVAQSGSTSAQVTNNSPAIAGNNNGGSYAHIAGQNPTRRLSNCSDSYSNFSEMSRRPSNCSEHAPQRRDSNCSENCPCSRRVSDFAPTEVYRKNSQCSIGSNSGERRFSNGSMQFERTFSNGSEGFTRRLSSEFANYERKPSVEPQQTNYDDGGNVGGGGGGYNVFPRRYSNNFNNVSNKLAAYDNAQYINGRRISTDSGYDRRYSFGSEYEGSPRSRTGSFLNNYKHGIDIDGQPRSRTNSFLDSSPRSRSGSLAQRNAENLVRTPLGPDGSKGFGSRARKFGQTISPVN